MTKAFKWHRIKDRKESVLALSSLFSISNNKRELKNPWTEKWIKEKFWF